MNLLKSVRNLALSFVCLSFLFAPQFTKNTMANAPQKQDWIIMFDGKTFANWRGYNRSDMPKCWTIEDGTLKINRRSASFEGNNDRGDIVFNQPFKNFEFEFEYKVSEGANSGIFYLAREFKGKAIYQSAPEYQVLDNENHPDAKMGKDGNRQSASLYDLIPATPQTSKPFGEWNIGKIVVNNGLVQHFLNGVKVVEYQLWGEDWKRMIDDSKFKGWTEMIETGGPEKTGLIGLQDHSDDVWFRNLRIRSLD
jgi:hypothetical protein